MAGENNIVIDKLKKHIELLISKYESALSDKTQLLHQKEVVENELKKNKEKIEISNNKIKELEEKVEKIELAKAFAASSTDVKEAKHKISKIVKEIDKCISLLND
jgi:uncharacterized protein YoxC